jgi:hypothetical protein
VLTQRKDRVRLLAVVVGTTVLALVAAGLGRLPLRAGAQLPAAGYDSPTGMYSNGALLMNGRLVTPAGAVSPVGNFPENTRREIRRGDQQRPG